MSEQPTNQLLAQRRIEAFAHQQGGDLRLAQHAALPVVLSPDLLHLIRINFLLDEPDPPLYTAESDLLLSPLCEEIGEGLYEIDHAARDILLRSLVYAYGQTRLRDIASLLWQYSHNSLTWAERPGLERAQQLTALNILDPAQAAAWLSEAEVQSGSTGAVEQEWFVVMGRELERREEDLHNKNLDLSYQRGLAELRKQIHADDQSYAEFLGYDERLRKTYAEERRYGASERIRAERTGIVDWLNSFALLKLGMSFEDLCLRPASTGARILVVDPALNSRKLLRFLFEEAGYQVAVAESGVIALQLVRWFQPQLITLELVMPDMDGFEVLQQLRNDPNSREISVIIISTRSVREQALALGANGFFTKPVEAKELLDEVRTLIILPPAVSAEEEKLFSAREELEAFIEKIKEEYRARRISLELTVDSKEYILQKAFAPQGAKHSLREQLLQFVEDPLNELLSSGGISEGSRVLVAATTVDEAGSALKFLVEPAQEPQEGQESLPLARTYEETGRIEDAAQLYEQAGDLVKAANLYHSSGQIERAAQIWQSLGQWERLADARIEDGNLAEAARLLEQHGQHERAAELYEAAAQLGHALILRIQLRHWNRVADLAFRLGNYIQAGQAHEQLGQGLRAAEAYERAAQQAGAAAPIDEDRAAELYELAAKFYEGAFEDQHADQCRRQVRRYRHLPEITVSGGTESAFVEYQWNTLKLRARNTGYGEATNITMTVRGPFDVDRNKTEIARLAPGRSVAWEIPVRPQREQYGPAVPLEIIIIYRDMHDEVYSVQRRISIHVLRQDAAPKIGKRSDRPILVVDDEPAICDTIAEILGYEGYRVITTSQGSEALLQAKADPPALILLDLMMPGMSGWQVIAALKASPQTRQIPIVVLSARRDLPAIASDLGIITYLPKPFDLDKLVSIAKQYMSISQPSSIDPS